MSMTAKETTIQFKSNGDVKSIPAAGGGGFKLFPKLNRQFLRELLAEAIGTGEIVFWGTGSVMSAVYTDSLVGLFQIAAVWIIGVTIAIATTGPISGAHLNPSISFAFALLRPNEKYGWNKFIPYCIAQMLGAVFASWCNYMMYANAIRAYEERENIDRDGPFPDAVQSAKCFGEYYLDPITTEQAFFAEALGTAVLAFVIFALTHPNNDTMKNSVYIPPLIGATVGGLISIIAPLTQGGFNPARDFGPRIIAYAYGWTEVAFVQSWLYIVAPMVGAPIGAALADFLFFSNNNNESSPDNNNNNNKPQEGPVTGSESSSDEKISFKNKLLSDDDDDDVDAMGVEVRREDE